MDLHTLIEKYLIHCELQKGSNSKTIKAYRIDLSQFESYAKEQENGSSKELICSYLESLHSKYKPKSIKRKLATLKAFYEYPLMAVLFYVLKKALKSDEKYVMILEK